MVLNQPVLTRGAWQGVVEKMRETYKAPIAAPDVPAIVHYLTGVPKLFGGEFRSVRRTETF